MKITSYEYKGYSIEKFGRRWLVTNTKGYETTQSNLVNCKSLIDYLVKEETK